MQIKHGGAPRMRVAEARLRMKTLRLPELLTREKHIMNTRTPRLSAATSRKGIDLLRDPLLNKGTAFTREERDALGLRGLLPPHVLTQDEQARRIMTNLRKFSDPLDRYVALNSLHDRNETLFFRVVIDHIERVPSVN